MELAVGWILYLCETGMLFGLLQGALCEAAFGKCSETSLGSRCCEHTANWSQLQEEQKLIVTTVPMVFGPFLGTTQSADYGPAWVLRSPGKVFISVPPPS